MQGIEAVYARAFLVIIVEHVVRRLRSGTTADIANVVVCALKTFPPGIKEGEQK